MPNKRIGRTIYHKKGGRWVKKQTCRSVESAKRAMRLLRGVRGGWKPTRNR